MTKGCEIENYIDPDVYETCLIKTHPSAKKIANKSVFSNLPRYVKKSSKKEFVASKIKVAKEVINTPINLSILDLEKKSIWS